MATALRNHRLTSASDRPSYTVKPEGRVIPTDPYGNKLYHRPGFKADGAKVYAVDPYGNRRQQAYVVKPAKAFEQAKARAGKK